MPPVFTKGSKFNVIEYGSQPKTTLFSALSAFFRTLLKR